MINRLETYLHQRLKEKLPGKRAHLEVSPYRNVTFGEKELNQAKKSSVLILLYKKNNITYIPLIQRTTYNGSHSGQVSFPGGKVEPTDSSIIHTALREANEEIGVISKNINIIGQLTDVYIPVSNFHVVPIVGVLKKTPDFILETKEVEDLIELKVSDLLNHQLVENKVKISDHTTMKVPSFKHQQKIIWGATALMLNELKHILSEI